MSKVILDFSKTNYSDAAACENNNLIHQSKMAQIMNIWEELYERAKYESDDWRSENSLKMKRCHNAISIFASRGAGKTTFLLSVLNKIEKDYKDDVLCLEPMDPSLIDMKQHPFINIIASIQEKVEAKYSKGELYDTRCDDFECRKRFGECYKKMLKALPFIDGIGKKGVYEEWDDEEFVSIQGMEKAEASNNLEKLFHTYVKMALKILRKKCLVVSFDDIDTEFKKGYEILEVIRKYLTSEQVVTIITGDLELYGKLVRKASWKCFDLSFLRKEIYYGLRKKEEFSLMVDQLENQYLVKILKPENRILLKTIREYLEEEDYSISVKLSDSQEKDIKDCYNEVIELAGLEKMNLKMTKEIVNFLQGLSLRVQIRILTLLNNYLKKGSKRSGSVVSNMDVSSGLLDIFWNDINQKSYNAKALIKAGPVYTIEMLKFLVSTNALYTGTNFLPETNDDILNKALFAIGARFNELVNVGKNNFLIFDYWIRVSYIQVATEKMGGKINPDVIRRFLDFTLMDADAGLNKSTGLAHAFCNYMLNAPLFNEIETLPGTIFIGRESPLQLLEYNYILTLLPMLGTMNTMGKESVFVSIYQLLTVIRDILFILKSVEGKGIRAEVLNMHLNKLGQYRNYLEPYDEGPVQRTAENKEEKEWGTLEIQKERNLESFKSMAMRFLNWSYLDVKVSCQMLDRVFTRFYFTLVNIDQNQQNKEKYYKNVGEKFNLYVIALLNAALVENAVDEGLDGLNFNNIGDIEQIYIENVQTYNERRNDKGKGKMSERACLYQWLLQCPLLTLFLNPLVANLIEPEVGDKRQMLGELLRYGRITVALHSLEPIQQELKNKLSECENNIKWMNVFYRLKEEDEELAFIQKFADMEKNNMRVVLQHTMDILGKIEKLKQSRQKLREELENSLELEGCDIPITFRTEKSLVDNWYAAEQQKKKEIQIKINHINREMEELKRKESDIKGFVREDYCMMEETKRQALRYSVYDILSSISLR